MRRFLTLCLVCCSAALTAGEVNYVRVEHEDNEYRLRLSMTVEARQADIFALLTDHDRFHRISKVLTGSTRLRHPDGDKIRRQLVIETCVLFFCFEAVMVEDVEEFPDGKIIATMVPDQSDFDYGRTEWLVRAVDADHTEIVYRCELRPAFRVPPVIGPFLLKYKMIREAKDSILNIERLAGRL